MREQFGESLFPPCGLPLLSPPGLVQRPLPPGGFLRRQPSADARGAGIRPDISRKPSRADKNSVAAHKMS